MERSCLPPAGRGGIDRHRAGFPRSRIESVMLRVSRQRVGSRAALLLCALAAAVVSPPPGRAQERGNVPEGIRLGPWILTPRLFQGVELQDNVFRRPEGAQSDQVRRTTLGIGGTLPVRNSFFELEYEADRYGYKKFQFSRDWSQEGRAAWRMNFASGDRLLLSERHLAGITDTLAVDEGGELIFQGQPYDQNVLEAELSRTVPRRQGYLIRVSRIDLNWTEPEDDRQVPYFDYRGFDTRYEYLHPFPPANWLVVYSDMRRFDHYRPRGYLDPVTGLPAWELGDAFRREESGSVQLGFRGVLGREQPFTARVGWGSFRYTGREPTNEDFRGVVGMVQWTVRAGARTRVELRVNRRPLPSSFSTYYIVNELRVRAAREWLRYSRGGIELLYSRNRYGEVVSGTGCAGVLRADDRWSVQAFTDWLVSSRFGFRVAAAHYERSSNCAGASYSANSLTAGLTLGWF